MNDNEMSQDMMVPVDPNMEWIVTDSVFYDLFAKQDYLFQAYQALHP